MLKHQMLILNRSHKRAPKLHCRGLFQTPIAA
jgi:hypothetical protein